MQRYLSVLNEVERYRHLTDEEKEHLVRSVIEKPYMDLRCDWAFKYVFKDLNLLKMLLEDILPEDVRSVEKLEHLPNEIDKMRPDDKNIIMDVLVKTNDGREIIVEMQRKKKTSFQNRMLYYGASMLHGQLKRKESYSKLKPVYVICFMDYSLPHQTDQLVYRYVLRETTSGEWYGNQFSLFFCELPRFKKASMDGLDPVESWFYILKNMCTFAGKPEDMGTRYSAIAEASRMTDLPDEEKLKYFRDMVTEEERLDIGMAYYEDGYNEGFKGGVAKGKSEDAQKMLQKGLPIELICEITGLSEQEIWAK